MCNGNIAITQRESFNDVTSKQVFEEEQKKKKKKDERLFVLLSECDE